jgi:hypothetical protein
VAVVSARAIVDRLAAEISMTPAERLQLETQILLVHHNTLALDLERMLNAERCVFYRDVLGIAAHYCPATGKERKRGRFYPLNVKVSNDVY